jgi:hypothetical protein
MKPYFKIRNYSGKYGLNQVQLYYSHKGEQLYIDTLVSGYADQIDHPLPIHFTDLLPI